MSVSISIGEGPLGPARPPMGGAGDVGSGGSGAWVRFEGIVRPDENGAVIVALDYEAYEPMASDVLRSLAEDVLARHGLGSIEVEHSRGRVRVGECSFRLTMTAGHRKPALAAMDEFIDRLKRDVPIWKKAVARQV